MLIEFAVQQGQARRAVNRMVGESGSGHAQPQQDRIGADEIVGIVKVQRSGVGLKVAHRRAAGFDQKVHRVELSFKVWRVRRTRFAGRGR